MPKRPRDTPMSGPLRIGGLCAGYGGLELGIQAVLDAETAWVSEIDPGASRILAHRFPGVPNLGDMTAVDWTTVPPIDVLAGGTPCQDLSKIGRRAGMTEGTRSNLWGAMREAIAVLRPRLVVWENVRGAYSARADSGLEIGPGLLGPPPGQPALRALGRVLGDLSDLGFDAEWIGLPASAPGVGGPHERFRVFVAAYPRGRVPGEILGSMVAEQSDQRCGRTPDHGPAERRDPRDPSQAPRPGLHEWRSLEPAVRRWARVTGNPVPDLHGDVRRIAEWMMGLEPGWVTDVPGISGSAAEHAIGNGVIPQQAAHALRLMLERVAA